MRIPTDKKKYLRNLYKSYKKIEKSNDLKDYVEWKEHIKKELKLLTKEELIGLNTYYNNQVALFERGKTYNISTSLVAIISASASIITGMIVYISGVIDNAIAVMATQIQSTAEQEIVFNIISDEIGYAKTGVILFAILAMIILIAGGVWLIKEFCDSWSANRFYLFDLEMRKITKKQINKRNKYCAKIQNRGVEGYNNKKSNSNPIRQHRRTNGKSCDDNKAFQEKRKEIYKRSVKVLGHYFVYYAVVFAVYCVLNVTMDINYITIKNWVICSIFIFVILVLLEWIGNMPIVVSTEKKILSKDDVDPQLKNIPIEQYKDVLAKRDENEIIEKYRKLHEQKRRRFDITIKSVYSSLAAALLPVIVTKIVESKNNINNSDIVNLMVSFVFILPLLLDVVLTIFNIIENDKIQRTSSLEKDIQDEIVKELASEYLKIRI